MNESMNEWIHGYHLLPHCRGISVYRAKPIVCVLKCRFYYYSGMVKPTDQKMIAIEKTVHYTCRPQEKRTHHAMGGRAHRETPGSVRRQKD